jgi:isopropylmalate/homocitrate/citramalate synthase
MENVENSEYNMLPDVVKSLSFADEVYIVDSTIRSLQSGVSGSNHSVKDVVEIGKALDELGVRELIVNLSWKDGLQICEGLAAEDLGCKVVGTFWAWHPSWKKWTEDGLRAGVDEICFESIPDADHMQRAADLVQSRGKTVSHGFAQIYSYQQVVDLCREGVKYGYESQSFHDSFFRFGITPEAMKFFIRSVKADVPQCPPLFVHLSNFYGHATMTVVAAVTAGASAPDVCMNGIGHHCGHTSLAEVVMVLEGLYGIDTGIRLEKLREVSLLVQARTGIPLQMTKSVVGDFTFLTDGAYWAAEADLPYEERVHARFPFAPATVGGEERVIWSDKTITRDSVAEKLASMGLAHRDGDTERITERLHEILRQKTDYPNWILDSDFEELCRAIISQADSETDGKEE